jgi:hypothetical protein
MSWTRRVVGVDHPIPGQDVAAVDVSPEVDATVAVRSPRLVSVSCVSIAERHDWPPAPARNEELLEEERWIHERAGEAERTIHRDSAGDGRG